MNPEISDNKIEEYPEMLAALPQEARDFLWDDTYKELLAKIAELCALSNDQQKVFSDVFTDSIVGFISPQEASVKLSSAGISPQTQQQALGYGYEYIVKPMVEYIADKNELEKELSDKNDTPSTAPDAPSPTEALATIQARLQTSATVAPTKRDYSLDNKPAASASAHAIDPYREIPH